MPNPQTIIRDGSGTRTATYQLPPGLFQYIESILVELDNGAAVAVRPTLKVETVNGQVMATKRQGESVPAGDTGTATWALRLTDEGGAGIQFEKDPQAGGWLYVETTGTNPATGNAVDLVATGTVNVQTTDAYFLTASHAQESVDGDWQIQAAQSGSGELQLESADEANLSAVTTLTISGEGGSLVFDGFGVKARFATGTKFSVLSPTAQPLFEVRADGSLHGKTGKTLTFDL